MTPEEAQRVLKASHKRQSLAKNEAAVLAWNRDNDTGQAVYVVKDLGADLTEADTFPPGPKLDWVVSGAESGPGRREVDVSCIENVARACKVAGVPHFTKQDGGPRPGSQGRISDEVWAMKEYPR